MGGETEPGGGESGADVGARVPVHPRALAGSSPLSARVYGPSGAADGRGRMERRRGGRNKNKESREVKGKKKKKRIRWDKKGGRNTAIE